MTFRPIRLVSLAVLALLAVPPALEAAPVRPADDDRLIATLPDSASGRTELKRLRAALAADPSNLERALAFARVAVREARERSDPRRYGEVEAALSPWWNDPAPLPSVRLLRAVVRQALHDFAAAEADLDAIVAATPANGQARLSRAFVRMAAGKTEAALDDCRRLPVSVGLLVGAACRARAEGLAGRSVEALALLDRALARGEPVTAGVARWAALVGAELAEMAGDPAEAERRYRAVEAPDVPHAAAFADFLLRTGRPAEALAVAEAQGEPEALLFVRTLAAAASRDAAAPGLVDRLADRFAAAEKAGLNLQPREDALFRLATGGDAAEALRLARRNFETQREPADVRLLLEAALAARDPAAAKPALDHIAATGLADARLKPILARLSEART